MDRLRRALSIFVLLPMIGILPFVECAWAGAAADVGSGDSIRAIRHDIPLLLARNEDLTNKNVVVDWVVTDDRDAVAAWHAGRHFRGVVALVRKSEKWWWRAGAATTPYSILGSWTAIESPGERLNDCGVPYSGPPSVQQLLSDGFINQTVASNLTDKLPKEAPGQPAGWGTRAFTMCDTFAIGSTGGGYDAAFERFPCSGDFVITGHSPGELQPATSDSERYYLFALKATPWCRSKTASRLAPESGRDTVGFSVWFPFILDTAKTYTLRLSNVTPPLQVIRGDLRNNVLTFRLPPFTVSAGQTAHGEVVGN